MKTDVRCQNGFLYEHHGAWYVRYYQRTSKEDGIDCSKSGSRSIVFARERLLVFFRHPILAASCAAFSMVIHLEG